MSRRVLTKFVLGLSALLLPLGFLQAAEKFEVREGDRIVLLGDTLIEREQHSSWLETTLYSRFADRHFIVRNLGWSADSPRGKSRASFDFNEVDKGFELLVKQVTEVKPTVIILGYGMANSFAGEAEAGRFETNMNRLIQTLQTDGPVRFVVLSPIRHLKMEPPLPDPADHNEQLEVYTGALSRVAKQHKFPFVDLFHWQPSGQTREVSDNGIHLTPTGYRLLAEEVERQLGWKTPFHASGKLEEQLRQLAIEKNVLFFNRWRPQNETYLFGFRKHEQGQNAREIPEFDPLVADKEKMIFALQDVISGKTKKVAEKAKGKHPAKDDRKISAQPEPVFDVAPGFEITLWAENPLMAKPIQMNFDPQGRLWVASSEIYPQIAPGQKANDKIIILEDTKGTGHADKSTVFADGLFMPTGVEPGDGGCYVGQSTELLHLTDTDGDGKADKKRVVLSGFGTEDTHHIVHTLRWGHDGMLYFDQSIYIHSHIETPNGVVRLNSGGIFHLRPPTMELEVYLRGFCNPWGHQFDEFGQSFVTDGAGSAGINFGIPGATYFTYADMRRELKSISPGSYPKFCGNEIIRSQQFPDDFQGNFLTADFRAHRVARFTVNEDGAGYVTKEMPDFIRSTNVTFRPIDLKFGPDGALYIADWSNPIINHGEVDFRDARRDHEHGRIWRITAKGRPVLPKKNLVKAKNETLFAELLSPNANSAQQSRRVLTERGTAILGDLKKWTRHQTNDAALLQALWMYQSLDVRNDALLDRVLQAKDGRIRAAGVRVLSFWTRSSSMETYAHLLADPFPRVRLEALRAVARVPSLRAAELVLNATDKPMDSFVDYAAWLSINDLARPWVEGIKAGVWSVTSHEKQLEFGLNAIPLDLAGEALGVLLDRQPLANNGDGPWIELIGHAGAANELQLLYDKVLRHQFNDAATLRALAALQSAADARGKQPAAKLAEIGKFFELSNDKVRVAAIHLAESWKVGVADELIALAGSAETPTAVRDAAFEALKKIGDAKSIAALKPLAAAPNDLVVRHSAVMALAAMDMANAGPVALTLLRDTTNEVDALSLWRDLLKNKDASAVLAKALPASGFPTVAGKAGLRAARETAKPESELVVAITRAAALQDAENMLTTNEIKQLVADVAAHGVASHGERIFRSAQQSCVSCHAIGGVGGKVGPDLTSIGASAQVDYLVESVFYPNKAIKEGYHAYLVETEDGEDLSGIFVRENADEYVIRTAADKEVSIPKKQIKKKTLGGSLMPSGLIDTLSHQDQLDLFRFLSELGKAGPFDASKGNVARSWKVTGDSIHSEQFGDQEIVSSDLSKPEWHTVFSLVDGRLLKKDIHASEAHDKGGVMHLYAGTKFRSAKAGPCHFTLTAPSGIALWIDGKSIPANKAITADLASGIHTIVLKLDVKKLPDYIKVSSDDGTFVGN